jgi:hypothetical protein
MYTYAQGSFPPDAGTIGTTAIHKDSSIFSGWATACTINRGPQNILDPSLGLASSGTANNATGHSGQHGTVSLGDGGSALLTFHYPIINGPGPDFAVFENAFNHFFLELAFVEVSSNGIDYVRFPSYSETPTNDQVGGFDQLDPTYIHNLAGKYKVNYGTPFDLEDLIDSTAIDINNINYVRIIDVVGLINSQHSTFDSDGHTINDPFPTPYATSGFDLDAVGVIHQLVNITEKTNSDVKVYPNPSNGRIQIQLINNNYQQLHIMDQTGKMIYQHNFDLVLENFSLNLATGVYILSASNQDVYHTQKIIIK